MAKRQRRSATKRTVASDNAKSFATALSLQILRITESHCVLSLVELEPLTQISVHVDSAHAMQTREDHFGLVIVTGVNVVARPSKPDNKSSLTVTAKAECVYAAASEPPAEEWPQIMMLGMLAAWPTLRDLVLSLSTRTGQQSIILPLLHIDPATYEVRFLLGDKQHSAPVGQIVP